MDHDEGGIGCSAIATASSGQVTDHLPTPVDKPFQVQSFHATSISANFHNDPLTGLIYVGRWAVLF